MFSGKLLMRLALNDLEDSKDEKSEEHKPHREGPDLEHVSVTLSFFKIVHFWLEKLIFKHKEGDLVLLFSYLQQLVLL